MNPVQLKRVVVLMVALIGLAMLVAWPSKPEVDQNYKGLDYGYTIGEVVSVEDQDCVNFRAYSEVPCGTATIRSVRGVDPAGVDQNLYRAGLKAGDKVILAYSQKPVSGTTVTTHIYSFWRLPLILAALLVVATLSWFVIGTKGLYAMLGVCLSLVVMLGYMIPAISSGRFPIAYVMLSASMIVVIVLFTTHGVSLKTFSAFLGTVSGMAVSSVLGTLVIQGARLSGITTSEGEWLASMLPGVNFSYVLAAMVVINGIGVMNDLTIAQASTIWELSRSDDPQDAMHLFRRGMEVGRDHVSSAIYTVTFSFLGATMISIMLSAQKNIPLHVLVQSSEMTAIILQMSVGIIGMVLSMPLTTFIAAQLRKKEASDAGS